MPPDVAVRPTFEPLHSGHAIEQAAVSVFMDRDVDDSTLSAIRRALGSPPDLPRRSDVRAMVVPFGPGALPARPAQSGIPSGFALSKFSGDGSVETQVLVDRASLAYHTTQYLGWPATIGHAMKHFEAALPHYVANVALAGVALTYVDKFVCNGSLEECTGAELLYPASPYVSPHVYGAKDLWHSHTGWFFRPTKHIKRLVNVNADFLEEPYGDGIRYAVVIRTALTDLFNQPRSERIEFDTATVVGAVRTHLEDLHTQSKILLSRIISEDMSKRIALLG